MTITKLQSELSDLLSQRESGNNEMLYRIISVEESLIRAIRRVPDEGNEHLLNEVTQQLVDHLVKYGTYLKTEYRKDNKAAAGNLRKALRYDRTIPLAHYRLGFLAYRDKKYTTAIRYFDQASECHTTNPQHRYALTEQQAYHAQLYKMNSALFVASEAYEASEQSIAQTDVEMKEIDAAAIQKLYDIIAWNTDILEQQALRLTEPAGERYCSWEDYEELLPEIQQTTLILDLTGNESVARYGMMKTALSVSAAELLQTLMTQSGKADGLRKEQVLDVFAETPRANTYTQKIRRLRQKLNRLCLPDDVIGTLPRDLLRERDISYYYKEDVLPYLIVERSDLV